MKTKSKPGPHRFPLSLLHYGNAYYLERMAALETALAARPRELHIELMGEGELPADWALLLRSVLNQRSPKTKLTTNARSRLLNATVLVWLLGDRRLIRDDAHLFFRRASATAAGEADKDEVWEEGELKYNDSFTEADPDEADYARVLQLINEFLPVSELAGRLVELPVLRQFGLVENEQLDRFLSTAFGHPQPAAAEPATAPKPKRERAKARNGGAGTLKK
ncbi:MAG: hypothetical protein P4N60_17030 [Verrucomicrobiae bacterium]|nr:hypothetical protein [Verrucomicrobiae bacterium]